MYTYPNGDVYEGAWERGKREGPGLWRFKNGTTRKCTFKNDLEEGESMEVTPDGMKEKQFWKEGKKVKQGNLADKKDGECIII